MLRIATFLLCLLLAAASAGRYRAEVSVRETRKEIENLQKEQIEEQRRIQVLRAELAYLESPDRLAKIAEDQTDLEPLMGQQLLTSGEFLTAFGVSAADDYQYTRDDRPVGKSDLVSSNTSYTAYSLAASSQN